MHVPLTFSLGDAEQDSALPRQRYRHLLTRSALCYRKLSQPLLSSSCQRTLSKSLCTSRSGPAALSQPLCPSDAVSATLSQAVPSLADSVLFTDMSHLQSEENWGVGLTACHTLW